MTQNDGLTERILGCAFRVHSELGPGFLEKVYENAMLHELTKAGLRVGAQQGMEVWYDGIVVGSYVVDLLVDQDVLVEIKATKGLEEAHIAQGLNYLRTTRKKVCLLLNFGGIKLEIRRLVPAPHWPKAPFAGDGQ